MLRPNPQPRQLLQTIITILPTLILTPLNRADILNLQVAGIPLSLSRTIQTKYLGAQCDVVLEPYCDTYYGQVDSYPMTPVPPLFCPNGSMSQNTRIGKCAGVA